MPEQIIEVWTDINISPAIAKWIKKHFGIPAKSFYDLNFQETDDADVFLIAKKEAVIILTKDEDFANLLQRLRPPPKIIHLTCGNTSNKELKNILGNTLMKAYHELLNTDEEIIEIAE